MYNLLYLSVFALRGTVFQSIECGWRIRKTVLYFHKENKTFMNHKCVFWKVHGDKLILGSVHLWAGYEVFPVSAGDRSITPTHTAL